MILYPEYTNKNFNIVIANKKEFKDHSYLDYNKNLTSDNESERRKMFTKYANELCHTSFELAPHQYFVHNFLSITSPYNSILLFHGLGTGKTCSAISIAENMRFYNTSANVINKIIIVASPNVQENFKKELFDINKLVEHGHGHFSSNGCTGNTYIKEVNPTNVNIKRQTLIERINRIIHDNYRFIGYTKFANEINKIMGEGSEEEQNENLRNYYDNRLVIIDEAHNIRTIDEQDKNATDALNKLVTATRSMRLCLLSGTPMYNDIKEIIWLLNILNLNDNHDEIYTNEIFNAKGEIIAGAEEKLIDRMRGYISFVRGENPYTFPFKLYPHEFVTDESFLLDKSNYPTNMMNGTKININDTIKYIDPFMNQMSPTQISAYHNVKKHILLANPAIMDSEQLGYLVISELVMTLNIAYPLIEPAASIKEDGPISTQYKKHFGQIGLNEFVSYKEQNMVKTNYQYRPGIIDTYGRIFSPPEIGKYSAKIKNICDSINSSIGISLIYAEHIDGGIVPMALALEECGYTRYGKGYNLFDPSPEVHLKHTYVIICGDPKISPDIDYDMKNLVNDNNSNGERIKVVIISRTGAEGLDFKCIRQVHIMEPWYNMNRIEQIIGRGVRNCSHKNLPIEMRNVEIYLHGSYIDEDEEAIDMYLYRFAEKKAINTGKVTRLIKRNAVDSALNIKQMDFGIEQLNVSIKQISSSGKTHPNYIIGDKPLSSLCDYMESCQYMSNHEKNALLVKMQSNNTDYSTYNELHVKYGSSKIKLLIKNLFKEKLFYHKEKLFGLVRKHRDYSDEQIANALIELTHDNGETVYDSFKRKGNIINISDYYLFKPIELDSVNSYDDIKQPLDIKPPKLLIKLPDIDDTIIVSGNSIEALLGNMLKKLDISKTKLIDLNEIKIGEDTSWYYYVSVLRNIMPDNSLFDKIIVHHMLDELLFSDTFNILGMINKIDAQPGNIQTLIRDIKEYFDSKIFSFEEKQHIVLFDKSIVLYQLDADTWTAVDDSILTYNRKKNAEFKAILNKTYRIESTLNNIIGAYKIAGRAATSGLNVFKIIDLSVSGTGSRCSDKPSSQIMAISKQLDPNYKKIFVPPYIETSEGFCVYNEIFLRLIDLKSSPQKIFFLSNVEHALIAPKKRK
jgi:superfamily II DNA or RNA helicase|uniref:Helicase ATP-binding domain-containing protein n=1 Tax=viral metagenome TaxID=1070528 RepID=A0A6C0BWT6_9ZZZZ